MRMMTTNVTTMDYFSNLPGFTYQFPRYTDWITIFLNQVEEQSKKDSSALSKDQKTDLQGLIKMHDRY